MKITLKYCRDLLDRHELVGEVCDGSDEVTTPKLKQILEAAAPDGRFRVSYDPVSYSDEEDSWDLIGPGLAYGSVYYPCRDDAEADRDALNSILREHFGPNPRQVEYTAEAYLAKSLLDSTCCPACGSSRVETNESCFRQAACIVLRGCGNCNSEWTETYALQGYQDLRID